MIKSSSVDVNSLSGAVGGAFWHNSEIILHVGSKSVNALGRTMEKYYHDLDEKWGVLVNSDFHEKIIDEAFIYHIGFKSEEDVRRRVARGTSGDFFLQSAWGEQSDEYVQALLKSYNKAEETRLVEIVDEMEQGAFARQIVAPPTGQNVALNKPAAQSSTCQWSRHQDTKQDAAGLVNGKARGLNSHHTDTEFEPWWEVDLEDVYVIREVHIFNRVDNMRDRFCNFVLRGSLDGSEWHLLHIKHDDQPIGGVDGKMYIWRPLEPLRLRHLRLTGIGEGLLELDQIAIYI